MWVKQSLITCFKSRVFVLLRRLNIVPSYLPKSPSAALLSIAVALATAQSSALHRKICSAQSGAIFNRRSNIIFIIKLTHSISSNLVLIPPLPRRYAVQVLEGAGKVQLVGIAYGVADIADGQLRQLQQLSRFDHAVGQ